MCFDPVSGTYVDYHHHHLNFQNLYWRMDQPWKQEVKENTAVLGVVATVMS